MHFDLASYVLGAATATVAGLTIDRWIFQPIARWLDRIQDRRNGRLRAR